MIYFIILLYYEAAASLSEDVQMFYLLTDMQMRVT